MMRKISPILAPAFALIGQQAIHARGSLKPPAAPALTQKSLPQLWEKLHADELELQSLRQTANATQHQVQTQLGIKLLAPERQMNWEFTI